MTLLKKIESFNEGSEINNLPSLSFNINKISLFKFCKYIKCKLTMDIKNLRLNYNKSTINFNNLKDNPFEYFLSWFSDALSINKNEANACVLSTVSNDLPSSRVILLKSVNENGFTFFTNYLSEKSQDIELNPNVALNFYWAELERQVRILGTAQKISRKDSESYFNLRPRESQIGAWVSKQSEDIDLQHDFSKHIDKIKNKFKDTDIKAPLYWGGYLIAPSKFEFWQGRPSRLHDRLIYELEDGDWIKTRLAP